MTSSQAAIRVEGVGKRYLVQHGPPPSLAETVTQRLTRRRQARRAEFWALRDVSFELRRGDALGLVGRNGAGKSTLLKTIARITPPTEGRIVVDGRIATLLEVGTGFHPELTGRENVFLNGTILGMRRQEIASKLDQIVDFSGVASFLDEPVKHYSSGMRVRLAFSVAAHLEADIVLVDEVLAVGDADFQRKCMGKMHDVAEAGRTVVFVSHNLNAVQRLCNRALLIESGQLELDASPGEVIGRYLERWGPAQTGGTAVLADDMPRNGNGRARTRRITLTDLAGNELSALHLGQPFRVRFLIESFDEVPDAVFELGVNGADGDRIATAQNIDGERPPAHLGVGVQELDAELRMTLLPGEYSLTLAIHHRSGRTLDYVDEALGFTVLNSAEAGGDHYPWPDVRGYVRPQSEWSVGVPA